MEDEETTTTNNDIDVIDGCRQRYSISVDKIYKSINEKPIRGRQILVTASYAKRYHGSSFSSPLSAAAAASAHDVGAAGRRHDRRRRRRLWMVDDATVIVQYTYRVAFF